MNTGLPSTFLVPTTSHLFNYLRAGGALVSVALSVAIVAAKAPGGTAVVGTVYPVEDAATIDVLGGISSEGAILARKAIECATFFGEGPQVRITFVNEPGGGVANIQTITSSGAAAASDGNQVIKVAGRLFQIGVQTGTIPSANAAAVHAVLRAAQETLPVTISVAGAVVTATHPTKGVNGTGVKIEILQQVPGLTLALATTAVGLGAVDIQPALDALAPIRYSGIAIANKTTTDVTAILGDINARWAVTSKNWSHYFVGETGTIGAATTLAAAANHQAVVVANWEGCPCAPGELAIAAAMLVFSRAKANSGYNGAIIPLPPPAENLFYTPGEKNTAIRAGLTVFDPVIDSTGSVTQGRAKCVRMVTTRTTTAAGFPDDRNIDIAVSRVGIELAIQLDAAADAALGNETNPNGVSQEDSEVLIRDLGSAVLRAEARAGVISSRHVEADVSALVIEADVNVLGRNNVRIQYHPLIPLSQVAWVHDIVVGG